MTDQLIMAVHMIPTLSKKQMAMHTSEICIQNSSKVKTCNSLRYDTLLPAISTTKSRFTGHQHSQDVVKVYYIYIVIP